MNKKKLFGKSFLCLLFIATILFCFISLNNFLFGLKHFSQIRIMMGTYVKISAYHKNLDHLVTAVSEGFQEIEALSKVMSVYDDSSELSLLNKSPKPAKYKVSDHLWNILVIADGVYKKSNGAFDATIAPISDLWKMAMDRNMAPSEAELKNVLQRVGWDNVVLHYREQEIEFLKDGIELNFDGVAKGYAVDLAVAKMNKMGISNCLVDGGGDIYCSGKPLGRSNWNVGVRDPRDKKKVDKIIGVSNMAVVTSGDYERYYTIRNKKYSQIFSPQTGLPVNEVVSVTVIAQTSAYADAWATAIMALGVDKGMEILSKHDNVHAFIISSKGGVLVKNATTGFSHFEKK